MGPKRLVVKYGRFDLLECGHEIFGSGHYKNKPKTRDCWKCAKKIPKDVDMTEFNLSMITGNEPPLETPDDIHEREIEEAVAAERLLICDTILMPLIESVKGALPDHDWACHYPDDVPVCNPGCRVCPVDEAVANALKFIAEKP